MHLVELCERVLLQFVRRNVKLQLVFFEQACWLWQHDPSKLFARRALIAHLQEKAVSPLLDVAVWSEAWSSPSWQQNMAILDPNWILCFDAALADREAARDYFGAISAHHMNALHCNVVLVPLLEFRGNDIEAWVKLPPLESPPAIEGPWTTYAPAVPASSSRLSAADAVAAALNECKGAEESVLAAIGTCFAAMKEIPLAARFVSLKGEAGDEKVLKALNQFYTALLPHASADLIDVVDGRFLHHVLRNKIDVATLKSSSVAKAAPAANNGASAAPAAAAAPASAASAVASAQVEAAAVPDSWDSAPLADSWDMAPADSWADVDLSSIKVDVSDGPVATATPAAAAVAAPFAAATAVAAAPVADAGSLSLLKKLPTPQPRLGKDIVLGEPKKKLEKKTKREMKGEQRAAHFEKLQADSLLGRYVQKHVITLDKRQVKLSSKTIKAKEVAAQNERAKQEDNWKSWLQNNDKGDTAKAYMFVMDNEFQEDLEFEILLAIVEHARTMETAMPLVAELVFRKCPAQERLAVVAEKWGFAGLGAQLRGKSTAPDAKWVRRQLIETGELLPREQGEADPRVKHFRPDPWQKQLLDYVDQNKSVVVVAPTSAGKTFIQYYVMEKVLREDDASVVVYVAPTKALCNQVMAGVNARYEKAYPQGSSSVLCGIFLRDRRHRAESCQILVTVPECLDILLLSPTKAGQNWAKKIKWILFDEVHTINDPLEGPVWERILQLTTCPFLALSATVGQPEAFRSWLSGTRKERVELIVHSERYNDLRLFLTSKPSGDSKAACDMLPLHPCTFVTTSMLAKEGAFPSLAEFESKDAFALWEAMVEVDASVKDLAPEVFFTEPVISRQASKQWGAAIRSRLIGWSREKPAACDRVLSVFNSRVQPDQVLLTGKNDEEQGLFELTQTLLKDGPALLFCHSREFTESMVKYYGEKLAQMQAESGPSAKKKKEQEKKADAMAKQKKQKEKRSKNKKEQEEAERYGEAAIESVVPMDEQYPVEFTLRRRDRKGLLGKEDREEIITSLRYKTHWPNSHPLIQGLRRGVGCHHEGLPHRYRVAVELMFRTGDITVVFATQTLAQGIHAPARSVVLVHDAPTFLTPTSLRQMTGRAGRRGYDLMGQVVFYGVTYKRVRQLLASRVPQLRGGFPLSASLTLRLVMLQNSGASSKELIDAQVEQLLSQPLLSQEGKRPELDDLLKHHFATFKALMYYVGLLSPSNDKAIWLAALASHLSYMDPANMCFIYCFGERVFDQFCNVEDPTLPEPQSKVLLALSCLLNPVEVHPTVVERYKGRVGTPYASQVVQEVPAWLREKILSYNSIVTQIFVEAASKVRATQGTKLPLSRVPIGAADSNATSVVSAFAQTSGVTEEHLSTLNRLVFGVRNDLCVDHTAVAVVPELTHVNSFIMDFARQLEPDANVIIRDNVLRLAWYKLSDFSTTLRVIATALTKLHEHYDTVMDSNIYRMLSDDTEPITLNTVEKSDPPAIRASKRIANAFAFLSSEFEKRFQKTKH